MITNKQVQAAQELANRQCEALRLFRCLPTQTEALQGASRETLLRGGNRSCVAGTVVWREDGSPDVIENVVVGEKIIGVDFSGVRKARAAAMVTSRNDFCEEVYKLTTKRGYTLRGVHDHPVYACPPSPPRYHNSVDPDYKKAEWVLLSALQPGWYVLMRDGEYVGWRGEVDNEAYFQGLMEGDGCYHEAHGYGKLSFHGHDEESLSEWVSEYVKSHGVNVYDTYHTSAHGVATEWCNKKYKEKFKKWKLNGAAQHLAGYIRGIVDAEGCITNDGKIVVVGVDLDLGERLHQLLLCFGVRSSKYIYKANPEKRHPSPRFRLQISGCSVRRYAESIGCGELKKSAKLKAIAEKRRNPPKSRIWWDRVSEVERCGEERIIAISTSTENYFSNGILSHNSGKSMLSAARFAAIATDRPLYDSSGKPIELRLPWQKGRCLTMWCVGYGEDHIGQTLYRLLFRAGAFKIIRDSKTGLWRAFRPWDKGDMQRSSEVKESPPLIPKRFIDVRDSNDGFVWSNKGARVFEKVKIWDPVSQQDLAEIYAFTSSGEVKAGDPVDEIWIDEAIKYPAHYAEWQARIIDRSGRIWWSSWPRVTNNALREITRRAREQLGDQEPTVREFVLTMSGNPHLPEGSKRDALRGWSDEEKMARDRGEYITDNLKMYPHFNKNIHRAVYEGDREDALSRAIRENNYMPPSDWTLEMVLDPGTTHPAVLFCAIPPPVYGDFFVPYDEIYLQNLDADQLASVILHKTSGRQFNRFIIDWHAARQTPMGFGKTVEANYAEALERRRIRCKMTGSWFSYGSDNVAGRILHLQSWMNLQKGGFPKLRIVVENCPNLVRQLENYEKKMAAGEVQELQPAKYQRIDVVQCLEYWAASDPEYVYVPHGEHKVSQMHQYYRDIIAEFGKKTREPETVCLGPGEASV